MICPGVSFESHTVCFAFFQEASRSTKRKQTASEMDSISLTPRKKLRADLPASPAEDSPRKPSLRLKPQTPTQTNTVRMSPRKAGPPPSAPARGQARAETPRGGSKVRQSKEDGAVTKSCTKTQVMRIQLLNTHLSVIPDDITCCRITQIRLLLLEL